MKTKENNSEEILEEKDKEVVQETLKDVNEQESNEVIDESIENNDQEIIEKVVEEKDYKIKYLESLAAMDNMRKRLDIEKVDLIKYSQSSLIQDLLPSIDMFKMALSSKDVSDEIKNWLIGFEMILKNIESSMEVNGVKEIKTKIGDDFDSACHMAIENKETEDFEPGKVIEIKNTGYKLYERLLRPTTVVVSVKKGEE